MSSYLYRNRNFQFGQEYGSAQWADPELVTKSGGPVLENNRLLSRPVQISKKGLSNNNTIVIGSPGTGKSTGIVIPNLLTASASYVVLDVKGELLDGYGNYLKEKGYRIKALNLKIMERSNPVSNPIFLHKDRGGYHQTGDQPPGEHHTSGFHEGRPLLGGRPLPFISCPCFIMYGWNAQRRSVP